MTILQSNYDIFYRNAKSWAWYFWVFYMGSKCSSVAVVSLSPSWSSPIPLYDLGSLDLPDLHTRSQPSCKEKIHKCHHLFSLQNWSFKSIKILWNFLMTNKVNKRHQIIQITIQSFYISLELYKNLLIIRTIFKKFNYHFNYANYINFVKKYSNMQISTKFYKKKKRYIICIIYHNTNCL